MNKTIEIKNKTNLIITKKKVLPYYIDVSAKKFQSSYNLEILFLNKINENFALIKEKSKAN